MINFNKYATLPSRITSAKVITQQGTAIKKLERRPRKIKLTQENKNFLKSIGLLK